MKKILPFSMFIIILISCIGIIITNKDTASNHNVYFELSHSNMGAEGRSSLNSYDSYYCITKDNRLLWTYGTGKLGDGTYGTFFSDIREKGEWILTEDEVDNLTSHIKRIIKYYEPVESNCMVGVNDADEFFIKVDNKFYEQSYPNGKRKMSEEEIKEKRSDPRWEIKDDLSFPNVERELLDLIESYHNKYKEVAKDYIIDEINCTVYSYAAFQENQSNLSTQQEQTEESSRTDRQQKGYSAGIKGYPS